MDIKLPSGVLLKGIPEGTPKEEIKRKAIAAGWASESDFGEQAPAESTSEVAVEQPKSYLTQAIAGAGIPSQLNAAAVQAANSQSQLETQARMNALQQSNPGLAAVINDMGPLEKAAVGFQSGLREVARGAGFSQADPATVQAEKALMDTSRAASAGEIAGQAAPFATIGGLAGNLASIPGRIAASTALGAEEGAIIAKGTGQSGQDQVKSGLLGAGIGAAAESIPIIGSVLSRYISRRTGQAVKPEQLVTAAGAPTPEFQQYLQQEGRTFDDAVKEATTESSTAETFSEAAQLNARQLESLTPEQVDAAASMAKVNPERMAAFERAGFAPEDVPIAAVSDNVRVAQMGAQLAAVPGSTAAEQLANTAKKVTEFARKTIDDAGGRIDAGTFSEETLKAMRDSRDAIYETENNAYKILGERIDESLAALPGKVSLRADKLKRELTEKAGKLKETELSNVEQRTLKVLSGKPTYYDIDNLRKEIGGSIGKLPAGVYHDQSQGTLKYLYGELQQAQDRFARGILNDNSLREAQTIVKERKALEDQIEFFGGNDGFGSMMKGLSQVASGLKSQDYKQFDQVMANLPPEYRKQALVSSLNKALKVSPEEGSNRTISAAEYEKLWANVKGDEALRSRFKNILGDETYSTLDDLQKLAAGLSRASSGKATGVAATAIKNWNKKNGLVDKLATTLKVGSRVGGGAAGSIAGQAVEGIAKIAAANQDSNIDKVSRLLSSPTFMRAAIESAKDPASAEAKALNAQLLKTKVANDFLASANADARRQILAAGGIPAWLMINEEEQQ